MSIPIKEALLEQKNQGIYMGCNDNLRVHKKLSKMLHGKGGGGPYREKKNNFSYTGIN